MIYRIDIPLDLEDMGPAATAEELDRFVVIYGDLIRAAYPETTVRVYHGSGFSRLYADTPEEERDANDHMLDLVQQAQHALWG